MAQEQPSIDSIYDFIYLDTKRLTSFLAQLDDDGVLLSIKKTKHIEEEQKNLGSLGLTGTRATTEDNTTLSKQSEKHYDSSIVAMYDVINRLDELGFIKKSISATAMGQLLLCSGTITFHDIRMMRDLWDPIMKHVINQQVSQAVSKHDKALLQNRTKEAEHLKSILTALPHALLMTLFSEGESLWSSLEEEHLKMNSDDITLKHGANFAGQWHVLGILDAKPDAGSTVPRKTGNELFDGMAEMLSIIRTTLGRPANAYGITPVAIFRTVSATQ
ncbi:MAG: DUF6414 family protein [Methylobacter sp.]